MAVLCIGGCCIPYSVIWPFLLLILKKIYEFCFPGTAVTKKVEETKEEKSSSCCCSTTAEDKLPSRETVFYLSSSEEYDQLLSGGGKVFMRFTATWCKPCQELNVLYTELAAANHSKAAFANVDVDAFDEIAAANGALSIPLIVFFRDGKEAGRLQGKDEVKVKRFFEEHL